MATSGPDPARRSAGAASRRREAILDIALGVLNARGAAAQIMDQVAACAGLDRASLYYYFRGREELIFAAYRHSYARLLDAMDAAVGDTAMARLEQLTRAIVLGPTPTTSLSEIGLLTADHRAEIDALRARFDTGLARLIEAGSADGSMSAYPAQLAARALEGALMLGVPWALRTGVAREAVADGVVEIVAHGRRPLAAPFDSEFARARTAVIHETLAAATDGARAAQKQEAMLTTATRLINQRGVNGMTLDDMVGALGITKGAFYHYFDSKDDLIFRCYTRTQVIVERYIADVHEEGGSGLAMLQRASFHNFAFQLSPIGPLALFTGVGSLPKDLRDLVIARAAVGSAAMREMAWRGIEDGSCRAYPVSIGQSVFAGASAWLNTWYDDAGTLGVERVAAALIPFYTNGLARRC